MSFQISCDFDFFLFHFLISFLFYVKEGVTPLFIAAQEGQRQIVQLLLEKGKPNLSLAMKVLLFFFLLCYYVILNLLLIFFSFSFSLSHFSIFFLM